MNRKGDVLRLNFKRILGFLLVLVVVAVKDIVAAEVGLTHIQFGDKTRHGRNIVMEIWYPSSTPPKKEKNLKNSGFWKRLKIDRNLPFHESERKKPLILFSHEHAGSRFSSSWFGEGLARRGYIVVALDHFGATYYNPVLEYALGTHWNRPIDVTRSLDYLLKTAPWKEQIDPARIAVAGYEVGSLSVLWTTGCAPVLEKLRAESEAFAGIAAQPKYLAERLRRVNWGPAERNFEDPRISAGIILTPLFLSAFNLASSKPLLLIGVGEKSQSRFFEEAKEAAETFKHVKLVQFEKMPMEIFMNRCSELGCAVHPRLCRDVEQEKPRIQNLTLTLCDEFLKEVWPPSILRDE